MPTNPAHTIGPVSNVAAVLTAVAIIFLLAHLPRKEISTSKKATEKAPEKGKGASPEKDEQHRQIKRLIDALASTNPVPKQLGKGGDLELFYAPEYSQKAQEAVYRAGDKLISRGAIAFPLLFEHFDDKRFSYVTDTPGGEMTCPVGDACQHVVACQLEVYEKIGIYPRMVPDYFWDVAAPKSS